MKRFSVPALLLMSLVCCSLLVSTAAGSGPVAAAAPPRDLDIDTATVKSLLIATPEDIEFATLASAESGTGKTPDDILVEDALVFLANEIDRLYPDDYATASVADGILTLGFKGDVPVALSDDIGGVGLDIDVQTNLGTSERDINAALIDVFGQLRDLPGVVDASGGYDVHRLSLDYLVTVEPGHTAETLAGLLEAPEPYTVSVSIAVGPLGADDSVNGGGSLEILGTAGNKCTSGFGIAKGALTGIVTAGHCDDPLTYEDWPQQPETNIGSPDDVHIGEHGDMQIHLFTSLSTDNFYSTTTHILTDVTGVREPVNGITLCRYGITTGRQCDEVYAQGHCKYVDGEEVCNLTMMNNREADDGDSGGPWFSQGNAYGIHQGGKTWLFKSRDVFSTSTNFNLAFGATIRTS